MLNDLTIIIPTRNRYKSVNIQVDYIKGWGSQIFLLDGSDEKNSYLDDLSKKSHPFYYFHSKSSMEIAYNERREILNNIMSNYGFVRHPNEWWHFSLGDQMWAWQSNRKIAYYGRI